MSGKKTIVTLLRVSLLACPLLFTTPSFAMIDTPSVKVGFSPEGSASALVLDTINSAESSIRMMAYSFTDPDVMHALAKAKKRGVDVRIVVDDKGNTNRASQEAMKYINLLDIPLRTVDAFPKSSLLTETRLKPAPITSLVLLHARIQRMSLCLRICRM